MQAHLAQATQEKLPSISPPQATAPAEDLAELARDGALECMDSRGRSVEDDLL